MWPSFERAQQLKYRSLEDRMSTDMCEGGKEHFVQMPLNSFRCVHGLKGGVCCTPHDFKQGDKPQESTLRARRQAAIETNKRTKHAKVDDEDDYDFTAGMAKRAERGETDTEAKARRAVQSIKSIQMSPNKSPITAEAYCIRNSNPQLKAHQILIARRITQYPGVVVSASVGSGKTAMGVASAACAMENVKGINGTIVVTPAPLVTNFEGAIREYYIRYHPTALPTSKRKQANLPAGWQVTSYDKFWKQFQGLVHKPDKTEFFHAVEKLCHDKMLIFDEAHTLNGEVAISESKKTKGNVSHVKAFTCIVASKFSQRTILLTGTPVENSPFDAANLATMARGDGRYLSKSEFNEIMANPTYFGNFFRNTFYFYWISTDSPDFPKLKNAPVKETTIVMNDAQLHEYESVEVFGTKAIQLFGKDKNIEAFYNGLRRAANTMDGIKVDRIVKILKGLPNHKRKTIISSQFIEYGVDILDKALTAAKISFVKLTGKSSQTEREKAINAFKAGNDAKGKPVEVIILSTAGLQGLDFKGVRNIIITEPFWTSALETQTIGRGRRYKSHMHLPASERDVTVWKILLSKTDPLSIKVRDNITGSNLTVDEIVNGLAQKKDEENSAFLSRLKRIEIPDK